MRSVDLSVIAEKQVVVKLADVEVGIVGRDVLTNLVFVEFVGLQNHAGVKEWVEADEEMFFADVEFADLETEFHVGESIAFGSDTVTHHTAHGVAAAESLVQHALDEEVVVVVVEVEWSFASHGELRTHAVGEGDDVFINGDEMFE